MKPTDPPDAPTELRCTVERRGSACVVRLTGRLDVATAPIVRAAFLRCLVDEPDLAVLDLAEARLTDKIALTLFPALARCAAAWPGSAVVLAGAGPPLADALRRTTTSREMRLYPSADAALADAPHPDGARRLRQHLDRSMDATVTARQLVDRACRDWGQEALSDSAQLIITELVSNAVRHAGTEVDISVSLLQRYLRLSVRDGSRELPRHNTSEDPLREEGRGLTVIAALATGWGSTPTKDGKVVWAALPARFPSP